MSTLTNGIDTAEQELAVAEDGVTPRERELGAIIRAYSEVTELLKDSHEQLKREVGRLREELSGKNRQLRRRERLAALGEMAAGVAHEIRNPLGGIQMFASLLRRDLADRPEACRLVDKIINGVERLDRVVTDTLDFGRVAEPQPARVQLRTLICETVELAAARIEETGVAVELPAMADVRITTDAVLLQRALLNVLLNALEAAEPASNLEKSKSRKVETGAAEGAGEWESEKVRKWESQKGRRREGPDAGETPAVQGAGWQGDMVTRGDGNEGAFPRRPVTLSPCHPVTPSSSHTGGRVAIDVRMGSHERVVITVSDNGPGIAPDCMDRIFNPFFTTKGAGTGLGLAIVHQIVESLGGSVQAANRTGGGAVFSLSLPRAAPSLPPDRVTP